MCERSRTLAACTLDRTLAAPCMLRLATLATACMLGLASLATTASAQDVPTTARGSAYAPTKSADVALHGLSVTFEFDDDREAFRVNTLFELENRTAREVKLQLGLVEPRCESDADDEDPCGDPTSPRFESLESKLREAPLAARKARLDPKADLAPTLGALWLFDVRLKPNERAPVEHRYIAPAGPTTGSGMIAAFAARSAALWADPIDKATLTFLLPVNSCLVVEPEHLARRNRRVILREGAPWLQLTYGAQRWSPKADVTLHFETCIPPRDTELSGCSQLDALSAFTYGASPDNETGPITRDELKKQLQQLSKTELQACGNAVFDAYASYYKPEELSVLANRPAAKRHYTAPLLTQDDWKWVSLVDEVLTERSKQNAAPKPKAADGGCAIAAQAQSHVSAAALALTAMCWLRRQKRRRG